MSLVGVGKLIVAMVLELPRCDGGGIGGGLVSGCLVVCAPGVGVFLCTSALAAEKTRRL